MHYKENISKEFGDYLLIWNTRTHIEDRNTLNVHVLGTTEVSDSLGIDEEAERCRKKYDKNIG